MPRVLCDTAVRWLDDLPPYEQGSKDFRGTLHAIGMEVERIEAAKERVRANFWPQTADELLLGVYETQFGLTVNPPDKTIAQRRVSVLAEERKINSDGSGLSWQDNLSALIGSGWTYREHDPADGTSPPPNVMVIRVPYATVIATPAQPSGVASGGGALVADTYHYKVTATNFYGETLPSPARDVVVTATQKVTLDWPDVAGATGYGVFRSRDGDPAGYQRIANVTSSAYVDSAMATIGPGPPTVNTTESFQAYEAKALARKITGAHIELNFTYGAGFILNVSRMGDAL